MLTEAVIAEIVEHVASCYPWEGCGLVVDRDGQLQVVPCDNVSAHPCRHYVLNPRQLLESSAAGQRVCLVYHSHCDGTDHFSQADHASATWTNAGRTEPLWPNVDHLVVAVRSGRVVSARQYGFDATRQRYREVSQLDWPCARLAPPIYTGPEPTDPHVAVLRQLDDTEPMHLNDERTGPIQEF